MTSSINAQVAQLAAEGHQTIAVIKLPSQATKKTRKPSVRRSSPKAAAPTIYTDAPKRDLTRTTSSFNRKARAERRAAAVERRLERAGLI